jgi:hypothetical protein
VEAGAIIRHLAAPEGSNRTRSAVTGSEDLWGWVQNAIGPGFRSLDPRLFMLVSPGTITCCKSAPHVIARENA